MPIGAHSLQVCIYKYIYVFNLQSNNIRKLSQSAGNSPKFWDPRIQGTCLFFQGHLPPAVFLLMPQGQRRIRWDLVLFEEGESWLDMTIASHDHLKLLFTPLAPPSLLQGPVKQIQVQVALPTLNVHSQSKNRFF